MPGTDFYNGMPQGASPTGFQSRSAEFSGGVSGGGSTHTVQQSAPTSFMPTSVLTNPLRPVEGQSQTTYDQNRVLHMAQA